MTIITITKSFPVTTFAVVVMGITLNLILTPGGAAEDSVAVSSVVEQVIETPNSSTEE